MSLRPRDRTGAIALAALVAVAPACAKTKDPGLKVRTVSADIVFGLKPPSPPSAPPGVALPPVTDDVVDDIPIEAPAPPIRPKPAPPQPTKFACPTATAGTFTEGVAPSVVTSPPKASTYGWKFAGPIDTSGAKEYPFGVNQRVVREITEISKVTERTSINATVVPGVPTQEKAPVFTYQMNSFFPDGRSTVDRFQVVSNATRVSIVNNAGPTFRDGEPDRGVALTGHFEFNKDKQLSSYFAPSTPLLLLPLPVVTSEDFRSTAVDPLTGSTYVLRGIVTKRVAVDACGKLIDGWAVEAQTQFTQATSAAVGGTAAAPTTTTAKYTYVIGTQLGALLTYEQLEPLTEVPLPGTGTAVDGGGPLTAPVPITPTAFEKTSLSIGKENP